MTSSYSGYETVQNGGAAFADSYDTSLFASQTAAFNAADLNHDGSIDRNEFRQFLGEIAQ